MSANVAAQKEGWAASLVGHLFPQWDKKNPKYATDVQIIFDWESSVGAFDYHDPLNLRSHGTFKDPMHARIAAERYLHSAKGKDMLAALRKGDENAARHALTVRHVKPVPKQKMPSPIDPDTGGYGQTGVPSIWDEIGGTIAGMPGQAGKDIGGIGDMLSKHMVLIVLVIVAVIVLSKK